MYVLFVDRRGRRQCLSHFLRSQSITRDGGCKVMVIAICGWKRVVEVNTKINVLRWTSVTSMCALEANGKRDGDAHPKHCPRPRKGL